MASHASRNGIRLRHLWLACLILAAPSYAAGQTQQASDPADKSKAGAAQAKAAAKKVRLAKIVLSGSLAESPGEATIFGDLGRDLRQTIVRIDKAAQDEQIAGMVLELKSPGVGRGRINELRQALRRFRRSGKKIHAYFESAATSTYQIAAACDDITMPESGDIMIPGIYTEMTFYKGLLDKVGLKAEFMHVGEAKGAAESFTRKNMSKSVRENLTDMVDDLYNQLIEDIATGRQKPAEEVKQLIDQGIFMATKARQRGLVDRVAYPDKFRQELAKSYGADELVYVLNYGKSKVDTDFSGTMGLIKLMQAMMGVQAPDKKAAQKKVAIVYAVGPIFTGKSQADLLGSQLMGSDTIIKALKDVDKDDKVVAVVFRIESPGGSALASDLIWQATQSMSKPLVASMGDMAGSGGYYIAMGCDKIYAEPGTITGSIGVGGGKIALGGLYKKVGVTTDSISRGARASIFNSTHQWSSQEREVVKGMMLDIYKQFTTKAAKGRRMPLERLEELAGGKVYTGRDAKQLGLIDELGTLHDAIAAAKRLAGIDEKDELGLKILPKPASFFETLFGDLDAEEKEARYRSARAFPSLGAATGMQTQLFGQLPPELVDLVRRTTLLRRLFRQRAALVMPYQLDIR